MAERRAWRLAGGDRERGQIMLLSIVFGVIALLLVTVVVSATSVHLQRKQLLILADDLALAGADSVALDSYYGGGVGTAGRPRGVVPLTDAGVRSAVEAYLSAHPDAAAGLSDLTVNRADTPEGRTARVTLTATATPALISWVTAPWSDGIAVQVTSSARAG